MKPILVTLAVAGLVAGAVHAAKAADGKEIYAKKCAMCHGAGKKAGDLLASKLSHADFTKYTKDPKSMNPKSTMPSFKGTDEELNAVVEYSMGMKK
ncbi:MAG: cytochrome c [Deltaproteobacteria bacterium]|nr:cytochrome c [Deltaproteobacteria bacterium]MDZ4224701.1 cytochrome c [bacterium]